MLKTFLESNIYRYYQLCWTTTTTLPWLKSSSSIWTCRFEFVDRGRQVLSSSASNFSCQTWTCLTTAPCSTGGKQVITLHSSDENARTPAAAASSSPPARLTPNCVTANPLAAELTAAPPELTAEPRLVIFGSDVPDLQPLPADCGQNQPLSEEVAAVVNQSVTGHVVVVVVCASRQGTSTCVEPGNAMGGETTESPEGHKAAPVTAAGYLTQCVRFWPHQETDCSLSDSLTIYFD